MGYSVFDWEVKMNKNLICKISTETKTNKSRIIYLFLIVLINSSLIIFPQSHRFQQPILTNGDLMAGNSITFRNNEKGLTVEPLLIDSIITNSITGGMLKNLFQYNVDNKMTEWLILDNTGNGWNNSIKNVYSYDFENKLLLEVSLGWNMSQWDSLTQIKYFYFQGNVLQYIFQDYTVNGWENASRANYEYDTVGNVKKIISETWINNDWQNSNQASYFYRFQNLTDSILFQTWDGNTWQNYSKCTFFYSVNLLDADSIIIKIWTGSNWLNYMKRLPTYDLNHNQIEIVDQTWSSNNWENSNQFLYSYNQYNYIETAYCKIWQNHQWVDGDGDIFFSNPDGFKVDFFSNRIFAYYSIANNVEENKSPFPGGYYLYQNYPNPFNSSSIIKYSIPKTSQVTLKIFNILGKEIATLVNEEKPAGSYTVNFDGSNLPTGVYIYRITTGNYSAAKKLILLK